jgi:hypothetical protein
MQTKTAPEVAETFRCSTRKVTDVARAHGIGANLGGRAGWRFTDSDELALWEAMRPKTAPVVRRRRRAAS